MLIVTPEIQDKIIAYIEGLTGAKGAFIMLSDVEIPCEEDLKGIKCSGHLTAGISKGIHDKYLIDMLHSHMDFLKEKTDKPQDPKNIINLKDLL